MRTVIILLAISLLSSITSYAQYINEDNKIGNDAVVITHRKNSDNSIDFLYTRKKPGYYTVYYSFSNMKNSNFSNGVKKAYVTQDRGILFKMRPSDPKRSIAYRSSYRVIRNMIDSKVNEDFPYLLPITKNEALKAKIFNELDYEEGNDVKEKTHITFTSNSPMALACRKGIVIDKLNEGETYDNGKISSLTRIKIEHPDGSLAVYEGFEKGGVLVKIGQHVHPLTPIGNLLIKEGNYELKLRIFSRREFDNNFRAAYINPKFSTAEGIVNLSDMQEYTSSYTDKIFFSDFSKREKKQYLKK